MKSRLWPCMLVLLAAACSKDDDVTNDDLSLYSDRFFDEAAARNITLDKSTLTVKFVDKSEIAPYSGYGTSNPPLVRLVKERWDLFNEVQREILMFHELGHAMLGRVHTNEMLPDCMHYKSMMLDGDQFVVYQDKTDEKRQYYFDELFDPRTKGPLWGGAAKTNRHELLENVTDGWQFFAVGGSVQTGTHESDDSFHIHSEAGGSGQSFWVVLVPTDNVPYNAALTVEFTVKTANLTGGTASVTLQPDLTKNKYFWTSTVLYYSLQGTHDWTTFRLVLNCYPDDRPQMSVYLNLMGGATGDVWFKDISVDYYN